jgi:hypothetical protein
MELGVTLSAQTLSLETHLLCAENVMLTARLAEDQLQTAHRVNKTAISHYFQRLNV